MLCTRTLTDNIDKDVVALFTMGNGPIVDPRSGEVLIDSLGRRSYTTSLAYGPSIGKNIALGYLPQAYCEEGRQLEIEYFNQKFPVRVEAVGMQPLYDRSEEHTSELQSLMRTSYAVFRLKNTTTHTP